MVNERELNEAIIKSVIQTNLIQSNIYVEVADNKGKSELRLAEPLTLKTPKFSETYIYLSF